MTCNPSRVRNSAASSFVNQQEVWRALFCESDGVCFAWMQFRKELCHRILVLDGNDFDELRKNGMNDAQFRLNRRGSG